MEFVKSGFVSGEFRLSLSDCDKWQERTGISETGRCMLV